MSRHGTKSEWADSSEMEVSAALTKWAKSRWIWRSDVFTGPLEIRDVTTYRLVVTRLLQARAEGKVSNPGPLPTDLVWYSGSVANVSVSYDGWDRAQWAAAREGTACTEACGVCHGARSRACGRCQGSGTQSCSRTQRCNACMGFGNHGGVTGLGPMMGGRTIDSLPTPYRQTAQRTRCGACGGRGEIPCMQCSGSGRAPCPACEHGRVACSACRATGIVSAWIHASVDFVPETRSTDVGEYRSSGSRDEESRFRHCLTISDRSDLLKAPPAILDAVRGEWEVLAPNEVRKRIQVLILAAVRVSYFNKRKHRTVHVIGEDQFVVAPAISRRSWWAVERPTGK